MSVLIGELRKTGTDLPKLFEAVRIADALGARIEISISEEPIPAPEGRDEHNYEKEAREKNSAVMWFYADVEES